MYNINKILHQLKTRLIEEKIESCPLPTANYVISVSDVKRVFDELNRKYSKGDIQVEFRQTRHFVERLADDRNLDYRKVKSITPCELREDLKALIDHHIGEIKRLGDNHMNAVAFESNIFLNIPFDIQVVKNSNGSFKLILTAVTAMVKRNFHPGSATSSKQAKKISYSA
jgi:hypothetical protein